jgi:NAD(P)-dependent dehydrogenase (short-subunit alcohol dehydrogenase family)
MQLRLSVVPQARHTSAMANRFQGRTVVVTGGASGIGYEMARLFAAEGGHVFAADLDPEGVPPDATGVRADVSNPDDVAALVDRAVDESGQIDVLCNNAGIGSTADPVACSVEEWDRVFAVNARGVFLGTKYALPHMLRRGAGSIVNTASVAGLVGLRDRAAYCASKGAVIAFTRQVALQYAGTGVRCNCICPGTVDSPWVGRLLDEADDPASARETLVARQPMGRLGLPEEIARAALYLASDDAAFVTGTALTIDGGLTAG